MSTHTLTTEIEMYLADDEVAYPKVQITYGYSPGRRAYTPRGEYAPIDPPEPAELEFIEAKLLDRDGLVFSTVKQILEAAEEWLYDAGFDYAVDCAEDDRHSMRNVR